jgi:ATP-dependent Lon protease
MLRRDVVEAVKTGKFHIYPVRTIDEGVEILTGVEAGKLGDDGSYEDGTVHGLVDRELQRLAKGLKDYSDGEEKEAKAEKKDKGPEPAAA